jgi:hypothetical protein
MAGRERAAEAGERGRGMKIVCTTEVEITYDPFFNERGDGHLKRLIAEVPAYMLPIDTPYREGQKIKITLTIEPIAGDVVARAVSKL